VSGRDDGAVGLSACFVLPLYIVAFVAGVNLLAWGIAERNNRRSEKHVRADDVDSDLRQSPR
jgi:hypothetical protein